MADIATIRDGYSEVRSRISWGAIMAGAVVSLAVYLVMTLLGAAIGLSVRNGSTAAGIGTMAAVWAVLTTVVSLFAGGWITARAVVGETTGEGAMHALIMWGVVMAMIMWLVASGARAGFGAMIGASQFSESNGRMASVEQTQRNAPEAANANAPAEGARQASEARQTINDHAAEATWWTLLGTLVSIAAGMAGGFMGSGARLPVAVSGGVRSPAAHAGS